MSKIVQSVSALSLLMTLALVGCNQKCDQKCQECFNACSTPCKDTLHAELAACGATHDCIKDATHKYKGCLEACVSKCVPPQ